MKLTDEEREALDALAGEPELDQDTRYRDSTGRTLTEIEQDSVSYKIDPRREGLMCYDNSHAELKAKRRDPRYTKYK